MSENIQPNAMQDVLTTCSHVQYAWELALHIEMPNTATIFDPQLSYETAITRLRARDNYSGGSTDNLPLLAYNRSVLTPVTEWGMGLRSRHAKGKLLIDDSLHKFKVNYGKMDINFFYFSKDIEDLERFEIAFGSHDGISELREVIVSIPDVGDFKYYARWEPELTEIEINLDENNHFKALAGQVTFYGFYFIFKATSSIITEINARIIVSSNLSKPLNDEIVYDRLIDGSPDVPIELNEVVSFLLLESGDFLLQENGFKLIKRIDYE